MCDEFNVSNPYVDMAFEDEADTELALSQAQGSWLDGYLDAMDELEDAMDEWENAVDEWEDSEDE